MRSRLLLRLVFTFLFCFTAKGQDIHWSQFFNNPLYLSPSEAGRFDADFRFVGNYRNQWKSVTIPFQTVNLSIDHRLKNYPNWGLGFQFMNDAVGDGKLKTNEFILSGAYQYAVPNSDLKLRPGLQMGLQTRALNPNAFYFDNQFKNGTFDISLPTGETGLGARTAAFTSGIGLSADNKFNVNNNTELTLALLNLNRPNQGFYNEKVKRDIRFNLFVQHTYEYSKTVHFLPAIQFNKQGKYKEFILGTQVKYILVNRMGVYRAMYGGLWFRNRDALYFSFGFDYQSWRLGISYDFNVSQLTPASNVRGGFELSLRYLLFTIKAKKINHRVCPDFI